jgi:hypothetical protein
LVALLREWFFPVQTDDQHETRDGGRLHRHQPAGQTPVLYSMRVVLPRGCKPGITLIGAVTSAVMAMKSGIATNGVTQADQIKTVFHETLQRMMAGK